MQGRPAAIASTRAEEVRVDSRSEREFLDFVTARSHALFRVAFALTGHQQAAEDLLQSALAKTAARWRRIEGAPEPYVRKILYHEHVSWWRRRSSAELPVAAIPDRGGGRDLSHDAVLRLTVARALLRLGPRHPGGRPGQPARHRRSPQAAADPVGQRYRHGTGAAAGPGAPVHGGGHAAGQLPQPGRKPECLRCARRPVPAGVLRPGGP